LLAPPGPETIEDRQLQTDEEVGITMRRALLILGAVLATCAIAVPTALAASPHFKKNGEPTCTVGGGTTSRTVQCSGVLAGLGGDDLQIDLTVSGFAVYQCQNPSGQNEPPGQNRVLVGPVTEPTEISGDEIKNGNLSFTTDAATLTAPTTVSGTQAGCNNNKWTGVNPTLTVTSITLDIFQPPGTRIFHCTASNPNGLTSPITLDC
jgi:hypothetical protein